MAGSDGALSAGDKLVEAGLATGQDGAPPGAGAPALLLPLREQTEVSVSPPNPPNPVRLSPPTQISSTRFCFGIPRMTETFSKLPYRRHATDICTDKYQTEKFQFHKLTAFLRV